MQFAQIIGLSDLKASLIRAFGQQHVAHAQLFQAAEGGGGFAMAWAFATYLLCSNKQPTDSCGHCPACQRMAKMAHPDVTYLFPTAGGKKVLSENLMPQWRELLAQNPYASLSDWLEKAGIKQGNIPVEEARQLIQNLSLKSYEGGYKIVFIWEADQLHTATANALLKLLEEPPENTLFFLCTSQPERLPVTIISRTQRVIIQDFSDENVEQFVTERLGVAPERAKQLAFLSNGNLAKAIALANETETDEHQWFAEWMRNCFVLKVPRLVAMADEFDKRTKEGQKEVLEYGLSIFRELFLLGYGGESLNRLTGQELTFVQRFGKAINLRNLEKISEVLSEAHYHIERNGRAKIIFLDVSLTLNLLLH